MESIKIIVHILENFQVKHLKIFKSKFKRIVVWKTSNTAESQFWKIKWNLSNLKFNFLGGFK